MRYTKIEIKGEAKNTSAKIGASDKGAMWIQVDITAAGATKTHYVQADDEGDRWSMAECLQQTLDGRRGTNSEIHEYFEVINRFSI